MSFIKKLFKPVLAMTLIVNLTSCYSMKMESKVYDSSIEFNNPQSYNVKAHFSKDYRAWYMFNGLLPLNSNEIIDQLTKDEIAGRPGLGIANLKMETKLDTTDFLISAGFIAAMALASGAYAMQNKGTTPEYAAMQASGITGLLMIFVPATRTCHVEGDIVEIKK